jgi:hypothetical protein
LRFAGSLSATGLHKNSLLKKFLLNAEGSPTVLRTKGAKGDFGTSEAHGRLEGESVLTIDSADGDLSATTPLFYGGSA